MDRWNEIDPDREEHQYWCGKECLVALVHKIIIRQKKKGRTGVVRPFLRSCLFLDFALDDIPIARGWRGGPSIRLRLTLGLALGIHLLAQRVEGILRFFRRLLNTLDILALCGLFEIIDLCLDSP